MAEVDAAASRFSWLRSWLPLLLILAATALFFALGLHRQLTIEGVAQHRAALALWVAELGPAAPLLYSLVYAAFAALSIPGAVVMTVAGGLLFGTAVGGLAALFGATLGATALFVVARSSLGEALRRRAGPAGQKLEAGFRANAASYLLMLRLVPMVPFWLVNLVAALLGMPVGTFVACSFVGMAPAAFAYANLGAGLGAILASGATPDLRLLLSPLLLRALVALAALALLPVLVKARARRAKR
jgi:uncharacterized membrane protein YdjX (TVP38/TMEM64 family)